MSDINRKKRAARQKRKRRVRKKITGSVQRPRLTVFRSHRNIYAQVVDDTVTGRSGQLGSHTLVAASSLKVADPQAPEDLSGKRAIAYQVGRELAAKAKEKGITQVIFDRNGYLYHGRVAALAKGVRDGGIEV